MSRDPALRELLDDLRHDLAKYLRLPFRLLPRDAPPDVVRVALDRALLRTQDTAVGTRSARQIYATVRAELVPLAAGDARLRTLDTAVATVLAWEAELQAGRTLDRVAVERDFEALARTIDAWYDEVSGG